MPAVDDLDVIQELLTGQPPSPGVNDYVRSRLTAVIAAESHPDAGRPARRGTRPRRRPRSRRTVIGMAAAGVAAAVAISLAVTVPGTPRPDVTGGRPGVVRLLARVATVAGRQPVPHVRDSEFEYVRSLETGYALTPASGQGRDQTSWHMHRTGPQERQSWLSVSDLCRPGLLRQAGSTVHTALPVAAPQGGVSAPATRCPDRGSLGAPTYRLLQSLPTDPVTLLHLINAFDSRQAGHPLRGEQAAAAAFSTISGLVGDSIVPPAAAAALYRAAALIPGVQMLPNAVDALGRHGVGVTLRAGAAWGPTEMIFDPQTLQLIGTFTSQPPHGRTVHGRTLPATFTVIQASGFVHRPGQLPHR